MSEELNPVLKEIAERAAKEMARRQWAKTVCVDLRVVAARIPKKVERAAERIGRMSLVDGYEIIHGVLRVAYKSSVHSSEVWPVLNIGDIFTSTQKMVVN